MGDDTMIDKVKKEAVRRGMKLMTNPKVMKMMADPRVMTAITQGFALKGKMQSEIDAKVRSLAGALNLATKEEIQTLKSTLQQMQSLVAEMNDEAKKTKD